MNSILLLFLMLPSMLFSGFNFGRKYEEAPVVEEAVKVEETEAIEAETPKTKIYISQQLRGQQNWSIIDLYDINLTKHATADMEDRVLLWTSAKAENGEINSGELNYWTLAVITNDGAYNLFYSRIDGMAYAEIYEKEVDGVETQVITLYIFDSTDRVIKNYTYDEDDDVFVEEQVFSAAEHSDRGFVNKYSTIPKAKVM